MNIRVKFAKGGEGIIPSYSLDYCIRTHKIVAFERSGGWAVIGIDPIRVRQLPTGRAHQREEDFLFVPRSPDLNQHSPS